MDPLESLIIGLASGLVGGSISFYFGQKLENYKFLISKKEKIANISRFFARWIKYRGHEEKWLQEGELIDYYEDLTRMSFELALWIDDEKLLKDVMNRLKNEDGSTNTVELLLKTRRLISGRKKTGLKEKDITIWPKDPSFLSKK